MHTDTLLVQSEEYFFIQLLTKAIGMQNSRKQFHILPGMEEK